MAASLSARTALGGVQLQQKARAGPARLNTQIVAAVKKVNSYDDQWTKGKDAGAGRGGLPPPPLPPAAAAATQQLDGSVRLDPVCSTGIGSVGIFLEDREKPAVNIFKQVEKKRLLSTVEKAGLLRCRGGAVLQGGCSHRDGGEEQERLDPWLWHGRRQLAPSSRTEGCLDAQCSPIPCGAPVPALTLQRGGEGWAVAVQD